MEKLDFPDRITLELTNQCNVSCTFCPRQIVPMEIGYMDKELYYKIIDEAASHLPVKLVVFFRGESLLHPEFIDFVSYAKEKRLGPVQFATNAYALTEEISEKLVETGIDFISFSLDTLDPQIYRKSRLKGNLADSMNNVKYLSELCRQRLKNGKNAPILQVSTIEISEYMSGQEDFVKYWKEYTDDVRIYFEHDDSGNFRNKDVQKMLEEKIPQRKPCRKVFTDFLVYWNGDLALCNYDWKGGIPKVNVRDMSIKEAWDSAEYENIRQMHLQNEFSDSIMCRNCQHWKIDYMENGYLGKMFEGKMKGYRE